MQQTRFIRAGKVAAILSIVPALIYSYASGPEPRKTGAPGDGTCADSGCHVGTAVNGGGGRVEVIFPGGLNYTPGQKQRLQVRITDAAARAYGFQLSTRPASDERNGQAGRLDATSSATQVICEEGNPRPAAGCRTTAPLEFIEHTSPSSTNTFELDWTAPATDIGNVRVFVAANAANGNGQNSGDRIYTANYTLAPQAASQKPVISQGGIVDAFARKTTIASGTWIEIYGQNLAKTTREWAGGDFQSNKAPTSLDGVSVNVRGIPAFVRFISPGQVNVQTPDDDVTGNTNIEVIVDGVKSDAVSVTKTASAPAFLAPASFNVGGRQYLVAQFPDGAFVGRPNLIAGANFRAAKPNDVIICYGIGFGAVVPATPAGQIVSQLTDLALPFVFRFGQTQAEVQFKGLAPNFVGLYQFNIKVPDVPDGDVQINAELGGARVDQTVFLTIQR